jgi:multicomponent Na+:H+ antiporter subunit E
MRRDLWLLVALVAIWILSWGGLTWANLVSGIAVAVGTLVAAPGVRGRTHAPVIRPIPTLVLAAHVLRDVVVSNVQLARLVVARRPRIATGVVRVPLAGCSDAVLTTIVNLVAMTPGTMTVEVGHDPTVIYVHVLYLDDPDAVRQGIWRLRDRLLRAFGTPDAIAAVERAAAESAAGGRR